VGIIGLTLPGGDRPFDLMINGLRGYCPFLAGFTDSIEAIQNEVDAIRDSADLRVVLSHAGVETDKLIAAECDSLDLILSGHDHCRLPLDAGRETATPILQYFVGAHHGQSGNDARTHSKKQNVAACEVVVDMATLRPSHVTVYDILTGGVIAGTD
jgi:2',3'-cyclic-nucleotide 2'-phosphodiesterase (5'-nucleotidase family)